MTMYRIEDSRTGRLVSVALFFTEGQAWARIYDWPARSAKGGRPDVDATHLRPVLICAGETTTEVES